MYAVPHSTAAKCLPAIGIHYRAYRDAASVCCVFALEFLFNPQFDLEPDYIIRKPLFCRIQRYILRRKVLSTFHTRVDNRSVHHYCIVFTPKLPLPFRRSPPNLIHPFRAWPHSPPKTASQSNQRCCQCSHLLTDRWQGRMFDHINTSLYGATRYIIMVNKYCPK